MTVNNLIQESLFPSFKKGDRVEVLSFAQTCVYGFGRIEMEVNARKGWYYVRFPQGEVEMVEACYILPAPDRI